MSSSRVITAGGMFITTITISTTTTTVMTAK